MNITAVVIAKNEEKNIEGCLKTLLGFDEILVIDDNSTDKTIEIAKKLGAKVFTRSLDNDFSQQRNFGLEKASNEWVLFVDSDERLSENLISEIENGEWKMENNVNGFYLKRRDYMWGKRLKHGESGNVKLLRLAKKDAGGWEGKVHEEWKIKGEIGTLQNPIEHYPHQSIAEFLKEINYYTDLRSKELYEKGVKVDFFSIILYPKAKFFQNYFLKLGILDGMEGLIFAILMSFHSFMVRGKLWLLWDKKKKS